MRYLLPLLLLASPAFADPRTDCPDANPCKVLLLNAQEEKILMDEKGILATAAQARNLDLGALATYFQQKISRAPAGDVAKPEPPKAAAPSADGTANLAPSNTTPK